MDLTKEQKEIYSKIADIKQDIQKNFFNIRDLTEQLISTLPFKEGDMVINQYGKLLFVQKIEPYDNAFGQLEHTYLGKIEVILTEINEEGQPTKRELWDLITDQDIKEIKLPSKKNELVSW